MRCDEATVHELIGEVYKAAVAPETWQDALQRICGQLDGVGFVTTLIGPTGVQMSATSRMDPRCTEIVMRRYSSPATNPLIAAMPGMPLGRFIRREEVVADGQYLASDLYNDAFRPLRLVHVGIGCLYRADGLLAPFGLIRDDGLDPLDGDEQRFLGTLFLHMRNALEIMVRTAAFAKRSDELSDTWDLLPTGVILVDGEGRVSFANRAARDVLDRREGLCHRCGMLHATDSAGAKRLRDLIAAAARTSSGAGWAAGGATSLSRPGGALPLSVLVTPMGRSAAAFAGSSVAVFVSDPERPIRPTIELLQQAFALTRAEAALVSHMLQGLDVTEAARELGIAVSTARTQVQAVFGKLGLSRQTDLVRRVVDSAAWIASGHPQLVESRSSKGRAPRIAAP